MVQAERVQGVTNKGPRCEMSGGWVVNMSWVYCKVNEKGMVMMEVLSMIFWVGFFFVCVV